tara:strand:+ start:1300 stop:1491 length:192 start_codon:yes stop_codon:yes gene_type:complete
MKIKNIAIKVGIMLIPAYIMAYFFGKMIWVLPMVVCCGMLLADIIPTTSTKARVDDEGTDANE